MVFTYMFLLHLFHLMGSVSLSTLIFIRLFCVHLNEKVKKFFPKKSSHAQELFQFHCSYCVCFSQFMID